MKILKKILKDLNQFDNRAHRLAQFELWRSTIDTEFFNHRYDKTPYLYNNLSLLKNLLDQTRLDNVDPLPYLYNLAYALLSVDTED